MILDFIIPGQPQGKGRPRVTMHGTYTPKSTKEYEEKVRKAWKDAGSIAFNGVPLCVTVNACFEPPKSTSKKKRAAMISTPHCKKPDADNIAKAVLDALNGLAFPDDSAVASLTVHKQYAQMSYVRVSIMEMRGAE